MTTSSDPTRIAHIPAHTRGRQANPGGADTMPFAQAQAGARNVDVDSYSKRRSQYVTRHGLPADYDGSDPYACNVVTKAGIPCRARALESGCCSKHGGSGEPLKKLAKTSGGTPGWADLVVARVQDMVTKHPDLRERLIDMLNA